MCRMMDLADVPQRHRRSYQQEFESSYRIGPPAKTIHDDVADIAESVMDERGITLERDIAVHGVAWYKSRGLFGGPSTFSLATSAPDLFQDDRPHILIVSEWVFNRLHEPQIRDAIAHELCHAYAAEVYGAEASREDANEFRATLEKFDAPLRFEGSLVPDAAEFYGGHP